MICFPNAKINIGLNITNRRPDGYHDISSCFYPVEWSDILEIVPANKTTFKSTGIDIPGDPTTNLCLKAYELIKKDHDIPPVKIHLHKVIPIGAGLGGGSADGAFALKLINAIFDLRLSWESLENYALQLGSDCPFFIQNISAYAEGTGEVLSSIEIDLSDKHLVLVNPGIHISTKEAYESITPSSPDISNKLVIENSPIETWKDLIQNDFETPLSNKYPAIHDIKEAFYSNGAVFSNMTGSGSTVYGIFDHKPEINLPDNYIAHYITPK